MSRWTSNNTLEYQARKNTEKCFSPCLPINNWRLLLLNLWTIEIRITYGLITAIMIVFAMDFFLCNMHVVDLGLISYIYHVILFQVCQNRIYQKRSQLVYLLMGCHIDTTVTLWIKSVVILCAWLVTYKHLCDWFNKKELLIPQYNSLEKKNILFLHTIQRKKK